MVATAHRLSKTGSLASNGTSASAARKRQSRQSFRYSATIHARRGHDRLVLLDTRAHIGNNSGRVLDQVASSFSSSISGPACPSAGASVTSLHTRRELWQERTPTSHDFPHIRPPHTKRRHAAPRGGIRARSARIRRGLSLKLYTYCASAKLPFISTRHWQLRLDRARVRTSIAPEAVTQRKRSMAMIQISEPFSPGKAAARADITPPERKTSLPFKSSNPSPLGCHPPTILNEPVIASTTSTNMPKPRLTLETAAKPLPKLHPNRHRKRDSFNRAKIHIRRPPKGTVHWFDAIDDVSDEEDSEVMDAASQKSPRTCSQASAFQPSLGPHRSRAAPLSKLVPSDSNPDYFTFREAFPRKLVLAGSKSPTATRRRRNRESQFAEANPLRFIAEKRFTDHAGDLSSDDEDERGSRPFSAKYFDLSTPSPGATGQVYLRRAASHRKTSINTHTARQSMSSAQSGFTSASLPFMLRVMPTFDGPPPLPDTPPATTPDCLPISYFALTGRLPCGSSGAASPYSDFRVSAIASSQGISDSLRKGSILSSPPLSAASRMMAVTDEEMALLEAMRRKRGQMVERRNSAQSSVLAHPAIMVPQLMPMPLRPSKRKESISRPLTANSDKQQIGDRKPSASSTITLEDGENIEFPTPPICDSRPSSKGQDDGAPSASRSTSIEYKSSGVEAADKTYHIPRQGSYWSPDLSGPTEAPGTEAPSTSVKVVSRPGTARSHRLRNLFAARMAEPRRPSNESFDESKFSIEFGDLNLQPLTHPGYNNAVDCAHTPGLPAVNAETGSIASSRHSMASVSSPGLTDGDNSSCGRLSLRHEAETPNKNCTFTANAFEVVDSSEDETLHPVAENRFAPSHLRRTETPLLGKVGDMYAFADKSGAAARDEGLALNGKSSRMDPGVLHAFHALSGGMAATR